VVVHQKVDLDAAAFAGAKCPKLIRELVGTIVADDEKGCATAHNLPGERHACQAEGFDLHGRSLGVVPGESVYRDFRDAPHIA
jgi:hypothetical protein